MGTRPVVLLVDNLDCHQRASGKCRDDETVLMFSRSQKEKEITDEVQ